MTLRTTLKLKQALLEKLDEQYPSVVSIAQQNIEKGRQRLSSEIELQYLDDWSSALSEKTALARMIEDTSVEGLSAWQVAPFAGVFTPKERWLILRNPE